MGKKGERGERDRVHTSNNADVRVVQRSRRSSYPSGIHSRVHRPNTAHALLWPLVNMCWYTIHTYMNFSHFSPLPSLLLSRHLILSRLSSLPPSLLITSYPFSCKYCKQARLPPVAAYPQASRLHLLNPL